MRPHAATSGAPRIAAPPTRAAAWYMVAVLIVAYTFSYIDRTVLTLMVAPIRATLRITDVQLSLLHGLAFAVFYTLMGVPIGRLVDRSRRMPIVATGIGLWSVMTALCGFARSFGWMFGARIGVGVGEAALSPAAYSMIADAFDGKRLVRALSVYQSAIYLGPAIATLLTGFLLERLSPIDLAFGRFEPWQLVFVIIGLPGLVVALLVTTLREPPRRGDGAAAPAPTFAAVRAHMGRHAKAYRYLIVGLCFQSIMWNGATAWIPTFLMRDHGWTPGDVAIGYGPVIAIFGVGGALSGGWIAGRWRERGATDANPRVAVLAGATALPFGMLAPLAPTGDLSLALFAGFLFCGAMPYGAAAAALQEITPNRMRGQVSAIYLLGLNLAGIGTGPTIVALVTAHGYGGDAMIGRAIATVCGVTAACSVVVLTRALAPYRSAIRSQSI